MKELFLIRHAKSSWKDEMLRDHDRPLNKRGLQNADELGAVLSTHVNTSTAVLSSSANRALSTAEIVVKHLNIDPSAIDVRNELYLIHSTDLFAFIHSLKDEWQRVLIFGHEPSISTVTNQLINGRLDEAITASCSYFQFDSNSWKGVSAQNNAETIHFNRRHWEGFKIH